jgi:hypothetical protein
MSQTDDTQETEEHELGVTKPFPSSYETNDWPINPSETKKKELKKWRRKSFFRRHKKSVVITLLLIGGIVGLVILIDRMSIRVNVGQLVLLMLISIFSDLVGLACVTFGGFQLARYSRCSSIKAYVEHSIIGEVQRGGNDYQSFVDYPILVAFKYVVNGKSYFSNGYEQVSFASGDAENAVEVAKVAREEVKKYPIGGQITVYYDPKKPQEHMLKHAVTNYIVIFVFGIIWSSVSIWLTITIW